MCGIAGILHAPDRQAIADMVRAMGHRGPDDHGIFVDDSVALGMTRLAILDLSPAGHQPMAGDDGRVHIVFNGEIYNFREQRQRLEARGRRFVSRSDTEVVLALYLEHGDDFVDYLRGMFAVAIHDRRDGPGRERLVLARDHFGMKPLLYAEAAGHFVFASELKSMLASGLVPREIDPSAIRELLALGSVYQPRTILTAVRALPPAHRMVISRGRTRIERYWSLGLDRVEGLRDAAYPEVLEAVESALGQSVSGQLVADVPVGAFLSGGIDSSLLVAMMAQRHNGPLKTYSVGFDDYGSDIDETDDAGMVAEHLGTDHTRVEVTGQDVLDSMDGIAAALDQPSVDGFNAYVVSGATGGGLKVAVSGTGGDELFAGYPWFATMDGFRGSPIRNGLARFARRPPFGAVSGRWAKRFRRWRGRDFLGKYARQHQIFGDAGALGLMSPGMRSASVMAPESAAALAARDELAGGSALERVSGLCLRGYTQNQLLRDIDAVSMAHSLEVRLPYLDHVLADTALSLPDTAKLGPPAADALPGSYRAGGVKRVLLDIGRKYLPPGFDTRPKRGFGMPLESWLRGPLAEHLNDALSPEQVRRRGLFDETAVSDVKTAFQEGRIGWTQPWLLMMTELWCRQVLTGRPGA